MKSTTSSSSSPFELQSSDTLLGRLGQVRSDIRKSCREKAQNHSRKKCWNREQRRASFDAMRSDFMLDVL